MNTDFKKWLDDQAQDSGVKIQSSSIFSGIVTDSFLNDPVCAFQIGCAILFNKPIVLIADRECKLPESLTKVAKLIERVDINNREDMARASESLRKILQEY